MRTKPLSMLALSLCLSATVSAQITGIRIIKPSAFDPETKTVSLTFVNDTPAEITALGYCIDVQNKPGFTVRHSVCVTEEMLMAVIENSITKLRGSAISTGPEFIRPGHEKLLRNSYAGMEDVAQARIEVTFVVFSDGTTQAADSRADSDLNMISNLRSSTLKQNLAVLEHAQAVLRDAGDAHAVASLSNRLSSDPMTSGPHALDRLKTHEAKSERQDVEEFVGEQQFRINALTKHQIRTGGLQ